MLREYCKIRRPPLPSCPVRTRARLYNLPYRRLPSGAPAPQANLFPFVRKDIGSDSRLGWEDLFFLLLLAGAVFESDEDSSPVSAAICTYFLKQAFNSNLTVVGLGAYRQSERGGENGKEDYNK